MTDSMSDRFLTFTKAQWTVTVSILVALTLLLNIYGLWTQSSLAQQGAESHAAVCSFKMDLERRAAQNRVFLRLTPSQIRKRYGAAFADIPRPALLQGLRNTESTINSLSSLHCREGGGSS